MKKLILNFALFIMFVSIFYVGILFLWGRYVPQILKPNLRYKLGSYGYTHSRLSEVKNVKDIDILFLGSSQAYRGFDTRIFKKNKYNTFNLGTTNQTPIQTKLLLERYLDKMNPKLIIFQVSAMTFTFDGVESALDIIANDQNDFYSRKMALDLNNIKVYNALLYGLIHDLFNLNLTFNENTIKGKDTYVSGGFVERELQFFKKESFKENKWNFNEKQFIVFNEILEILKEKKIEVVLVNTPTTSAVYNSYSNNNVFDSIMENKLKYLNFNKILQMDDSLNFYDSYHLNQNGVDIFNKKLINLLSNSIHKKEI